MNRCIRFIKREPVLSASLLLALLSAFIIPPDRAWIEYIDFRTLAILYSLMVIMSGFQKLGVFRSLGEHLIRRVHTIRGIAMILTGLCFLLSMFITNDVALLTFVPFTVIVLNMAGQKKHMIGIIVLETVAANLGSMMMPMGNPQNLYLYSLTSMTIPDFLRLMLPYGILSLLLITGLTFLLVGRGEAEPYRSAKRERSKKEKLRFGVYLVLFMIALLSVVRVLDWRIGLLLVFAGVMLADRQTATKADWALLLTFVFLFIFIGNLKRMPSVNHLLASTVAGNEILFSVLASQIISNVPAAILLSGFTQRIEYLIIGTNLGGLGTLIASMASLISFKLYCGTEGAEKGKYLIRFTVVNVVLLVLLAAVCVVLMK